MGIDPGSRITGYGVIESNGIKTHHIASGCVRVEGDDFPARLGMIFQRVSEIISEHRPREMAIEEAFFARNATSALKLGQARGAAICAAVTSGLTVKEYAPRTVKQAVVGTGGADKTQVQQMIKWMLNLSQDLGADQADALAIALCHAHSDATLNYRSRAGGRRR